MIPAKRNGACFFRWQEWEHFPVKILKFELWWLKSCNSLWQFIANQFYILCSCGSDSCSLSKGAGPASRERESSPEDGGVKDSFISWDQKLENSKVYYLLFEIKFRNCIGEKLVNWYRSQQHCIWEASYKDLAVSGSSDIKNDTVIYVM